MVGAGVTVGSSCLLGNDNAWLHYCQVLALTFVVVVALASIADLARPFEGAVSVTPVAFERALYDDAVTPGLKPCSRDELERAKAKALAVRLKMRGLQLLCRHMRNA